MIQDEFTNPKIAYLASLAKDWKGRLIKLSKVEFYKLPWDSKSNDEWSMAPFSQGGEMGVNFSEKTVVFYGNVPWPYLLHEMGHVFATTSHPNACAEEDFLGWEYQIGKGIDLDEWIKYNDNYEIELSDNTGTVLPIGKLPKRIVIDEMEKYVRRARRCGLITKSGTLKTLRGTCYRCQHS